MVYTRGQVGRSVVVYVQLRATASRRPAGGARVHERTDDLSSLLISSWSISGHAAHKGCAGLCRHGKEGDLPRPPG
jgi:hypothetical protein